jgi:hypothetical protein
LGEACAGDKEAIDIYPWAHMLGFAAIWKMALTLEIALDREK